MYRRRFLKSSAFVSASLVFACSKNYLTAPDVTVAPPPPQLTPQVTIEQGKVGKLVFSKTSPVAGSLYDVCQAVGLAVGTSHFDSDRVTGAALNGYAVVAINGDLGPPMVNVKGELTHCGWVIGIGNNHGFYNSVMEVSVKAGDQLDFYYGLPCSEPNRC